jgi:hypothetical protein
MELPTPVERPEREWAGQRFVHNRAAEGAWRPFRLPGYEARDTTIAANTKGIAGVQVVRKGQGETGFFSHGADILFGFVMEGSLVLEGTGQPSQPLSPWDAFVIPPGMATRWAQPSDDLRLIEVSLPGEVPTHPA